MSKEHLDSYTLQIVREKLISMDRMEAEESFREWGLDAEELTETALQLSLCPLHLIDYAICFDDNTQQCRVIRMVHPSHDT